MIAWPQQLGVFSLDNTFSRIDERQELHPRRAPLVHVYGEIKVMSNAVIAVTCWTPYIAHLDASKFSDYPSFPSALYTVAKLFLPHFLRCSC